MLGLSKEQAERYNRLLFFPQVEDMLSGDLPVAKVRPPDERFGSKISLGKVEPLIIKENHRDE